MKIAIHQLHKNLDTGKIIHWIKLVSVTGGAQAIVQATGLLSGILIIRLLSVQEYAYYTIANTMLGTMTLLSDGGISTGVMALGGKVWDDKEKLGSVIATGLNLRREFAVISLTISAPILLYLLIHQGASWGAAVLIAIALIPAFGAAISDSILEITPKLHQEIVKLQRNQLEVSIGRLLLNGLLLFITPLTFVAVLSNSLPRIYGNIQLRKITNEYISKQLLDIKIKKEILKIVKRNLPGAIFYCFSGQITIWILSYFGTIESIAKIGAIGRVSMILNLASVLFTTLFVPRFAKLPNLKSKLFKRFIQVESYFILILSLITYLVSVYPKYILWLLGEQYIDAVNELVYIFIASCVSLLSGISYTLSASRGWIINPYVSIVFSMISIIAGAGIFNVTQVMGVLYFNIFTAFCQYIMQSVYFLAEILKTKDNINE